MSPIPTRECSPKYGFVRSCVRPRGLVAKWNDISEGIRRFSFFLSAEPSLFPCVLAGRVPFSFCGTYLKPK